MADDTQSNDSAVAPSSAILEGRVVDVHNHPIAKARIYALAKAAALRPKLEIESDSQGRYRFELAPGSYSIIVVAGKVQAQREVTIEPHAVATINIELDVDPGANEVITVVDRELPAPAVKPRPEKPDSRKSLPYSNEAVTRNAWGLAWVLIDLDETGRVTRLKLLKRPGFDLDRIAIDEAFKLKFEPARDAQGRPVKTVFAWKLEWPSWGYLVTYMGTAAARPHEHRDVYLDPRNDPKIDAVWAQPLPVGEPKALSRVRCVNNGPAQLEAGHPGLRDCSKPNLERAFLDSLPWITRETIATALAEYDRVLPLPKRIPSQRSRVPALIATGVAGAMAAGLVTSLIQYTRYSDRAEQLQMREEFAANRAGLDRWKNYTIAFGAGTVVSAAVTAFLWGRRQSGESFSVQPTQGGASVSFGRSF
jgi:hypothetical protein